MALNGHNRDRAEEMNEKRTKPYRLLPGLLTLFGVTYASGILYFLLGWLGLQSVPSTWQRTSLPLYTCVFGLGTASVAAAIRWQRWGVYGLALTWAATVALNALFPSPVSLPAAIAAMLLGVLFVSQVRRAWSGFR